MIKSVYLSNFNLVKNGALYFSIKNIIPTMANQGAWCFYEATILV